ncbi:hypothetical protein WH47_04449, partial [Habropoda laboriosa]
SKYNLIPHELSPKNLLNHFYVCVSPRARQIQEDFLHRLATTDEKWVLHRGVTRRRHWSKLGQRPSGTNKENLTIKRSKVV